MRKRIRGSKIGVDPANCLRLFAAVIALLPLGSCDVLFNGVFPPAVGQITARADLSASIAAAPASYFSLSTVTAGGNEYVILFTDSAFDSSRPHVLVMDSHLKVLNAFSTSDLAPLGPPLNGTFTMSDVNGLVVIGNLRFNAQPAGFTLDPSYPNITLFGPSASGLPLYPYNWTNFRIESGLLKYDEYFPAWNPTGPSLGNCPVGTPSPPPPPQSFFRLSNIFTDPSSDAVPEVMIFQADGPSSLAYFLRVPKNDINFDLGTFVGASDLFTYAASNYPPLVVKSNLSSQGIAFSRAGVIAYDFQSDSLIRFTLDAPDSVDSLPLKHVNGMKLAAGISGSYCIVWDPVARTLTRYEQWW